MMMMMMIIIIIITIIIMRGMPNVAAEGRSVVISSTNAHASGDDDMTMMGMPNVAALRVRAHGGAIGLLWTHILIEWCID